MSLPGTHELNAVVLQLHQDADRIERQQRELGTHNERQLLYARYYRTGANIVARVRDLTLAGEYDRDARPTVTVQTIERHGPFADDEPASIAPESSVGPPLSPEDAEILKFVRASGGLDRVRKIVSAWSEELK
ncbi:hypothetical protein ACUSIJ_28865 [Pseudochelatococcus sp. B33]